MNERKMRVTIEFAIDDEALRDYNITAEQVANAVVLREHDTIDGFEITTNVPGYSPVDVFFLYGGTIVSKELLPAEQKEEKP